MASFSEMPFGAFPCEDADDGATDGGVVVDPSIYVGMPLIQLGPVGQGEDVADGAAGNVDALKVSTTAKLGKVPWCDFLGEEVGCGFDRVEVLVGSPVDEAKHVHGTGVPGLAVSCRRKE